jgi:hypothetical protein
MKERDARVEARERNLPLQHAADVLARSTTGDDWRDRVRTELRNVADALADHIERTEGPGGLYETLLDDAPRLSNDIRLLTKDHEILQGMIEALAIALDAETSDQQLIGETVVELVERLTRHRHTDADMVHEAYQVDIGGQA